MDGRARLAAALLCVLAAGAGAVDLVVSLTRDADYLTSNSAGSDVVAIGYAAAGAYVARHRPRNPVGWVLVGVAAAQGLHALAHVWAATDGMPGRLALAWLGSWVWFPGFAALPTVLVALYPSGRAGPRRRRLLGASLAGTALVAAALALSDSGVDDLLPGATNPVASPGAAVVLGLAGAAVLLPCVLLSVGDALRRLWSGPSPEREQLAWLLTTTVFAVMSSYPSLGPAGVLLNLLVPVGVAVGVVRHRLLDLQVVVRRTLLFAGLTGTVVLVFVATTAALSPLLERGPLPVAVAAALVAVGLTPARALLQRGVDRLVYGDRRDPLRAVASLGRDVAENDGERLVPQVLRTVAAAVRSPAVVLVDAAGEVQAGTGAPCGEPLRLPLQVAGAGVGELRVSPRTAHDAWSGDDRALLELLARQVALVVHAERLAAAVAASRDDVVAATVGERERLRAELHDGLGPALSGIALGLEAAELAVQRRPERVPVLLARLRAETQAAGREVRALVEGLRPAALDGTHLAAALRAYVSGVSDVSGLPVALELPAGLPELPHEVEAAAYRIVAEAVTNVVRHSGASSCTVRLVVDEALLLVVEDDGHGLPAQPREGVGLGSMRRRAAELGGTWTATARDGGGTRVVVQLPLRAAVPT